MNDIERTLGEHSAKIDTLQREMLTIQIDLKQILLTLSEARGGWRALMLVAGIAGAIGSVLTWFALYFGWHPK